MLVEKDCEKNKQKKNINLLNVLEISKCCY